MTRAGRGREATTSLTTRYPEQGATRRPSFLTPLAALLAMLALPGAAHALVACTAAEVSSQDPSCPSGSGPCNISRTFEVANGCNWAFGSRAVTVLASGRIDIASNAVTIEAGSFTIAPGGRVEGRGPMPAPRDKGGLLTITTTGAFNVQRSGSAKGVVDLSGDTRGGTFKVTAGGPITVSGDVVCNNLTPSGGNGSISLHSDADITTGGSSVIAVAGGELSSGGFIDISAKGKIDLGATLVATGGDGGVIDVQAGGEALVRGINVFGQGDAGSGGCVGVVAGTRVQMLGEVNLNGTGSATQSGGGCGGYIDIDARFGDISLTAPILSESGFPDGGGGGIGVVARGSITHAAAAPLSVRGNGGQSCGGEISLEADFDVTSSGFMDASGGFGGNLVDVIAGRNVVLNGMVDVQGRDGGGFGGSATIIGGDRGQGNVNVNSSINSTGGACGPIFGCGLGGFIEVTGCNVTVPSTAVLDSSGPDGGDNLVTAREKLTVQGVLDATAAPGMTAGENKLQHPTRVAPTINAANIDPDPMVVAFATCTTSPQANCLVPCPTCGNGTVEFPETCDTSGTPVNCDGCSNFCRVQNCNDGSVCTADSCDATLGCRNAPIGDGTSCTDNNICNGVEQCSFGLCRPTTPALNCNDNKQCTTDSCNPTLGCQNPASPAGTPCNDGNICTANDVCNASMVCAGQVGPCLPTTTSLPRPTTSTTSTSSTSSTSSSSTPTPTTSTTSTSSPVPTTTSTSSPVPTTTSTSSPTPTTTSTSTSSPVPTTTSTSTSNPVPTTTSSSEPGATSTSTSVPGATTTSTSRPASSTTSTSLPGGCVPANCDDGNACTADACQGGVCVHGRDGFDAVACELGRVQTSAANLCQPDPIFQKLAKGIAAKVTKARTMVGKAESNPKTAQKLLQRAAKQLTGLRNRITKAGDRGKITPACRATLDALLAERLALIQGLGTP